MDFGISLVIVGNGLWPFMNVIQRPIPEDSDVQWAGKSRVNVSVIIYEQMDICCSIKFQRGAAIWSHDLEEVGMLAGS